MRKEIAKRIISTTLMVNLLLTGATSAQVLDSTPAPEVDDVSVSVLAEVPAEKSVQYPFVYTANGLKWNCIWEPATKTLTVGIEKSDGIVNVHWMDKDSNGPFDTTALPAGTISRTLVEHLVFDKTVKGLSNFDSIFSWFSNLKTVTFLAEAPVRLIGSNRFLFNCRTIESISTVNGFDATKATGLIGAFLGIRIKDLNVQNLLSGYTYPTTDENGALYMFSIDSTSPTYGYGPINVRLPRDLTDVQIRKAYAYGLTIIPDAQREPVITSGILVSTSGTFSLGDKSVTIPENIRALVTNDKEMLVADVVAEGTVADLYRGTDRDKLLDTYYIPGTTGGRAIALLKNADGTYTTNPAYPGSATTKETYIPVSQKMVMVVPEEDFPGLFADVNGNTFYQDFDKNGDYGVVKVTGLAVAPAAVTLGAGQAKLLYATAIGENVEGSAQAATWSLAGNTSQRTTVRPDGNVVLGFDEKAKTITVTAISLIDAGKKGSATVTVSGSATVNAIRVTPSTADIAAGGQQLFAATVEGTNNPAQDVAWTLTGESSANTVIDQTGKLVLGADESSRTIQVRATSVADSGVTKTVSITVSSVGGATVTGVKLRSDVSRVQLGGSYQINAVVEGTGSPAQTVTWAVTGNTDAGTVINADGRLTIGANEKAKAITIKATSTTDLGKSGSLPLTIIDNAATVNKVTVTPGEVSLNKGGTTTFTAAVSGTNNPEQTVTWSTTGGSSASTVIDQSGNLTIGADETATTLTMKAISQVDGTKFGTATVTITSAPMVTVTSVTVTPNPVSVAKGGTMQFSASVMGTNNPDQTVSWELIGGTAAATQVNQSGKLTVGVDERADKVTVRAVSIVDGSKMGTATVTVTTTPVEEFTEIAKFDFNRNGSVDVTDALELVNIVTKVTVPSHDDEIALWALLFDSNGNMAVDVVDLAAAGVAAAGGGDKEMVNIPNRHLKYLK